MSATVIETHHLTKRFRGTTAVDEAGLAVRAGRIYGLLGPNGAGKSTTLKLVLGLLRPDAGEVRLFGQPWRRELLGRIGASINGPSFYPHLSARANLRVHARLLGLAEPAVDEVLRTVSLADTGKQRSGSFSTGMKSRLALAIALLGDPELLILDEPQNGLDPEGILELRTLMKHLTDTGHSVVFSSHILSEIAQVADDIGGIVAGRLRFQGTAAEFAPDGDLEHSYFQLTAAAAR